MIIFLIVSGLAYYGSALLGMAIFSLHPSNITLLWLPFGIGVIMVQRFGIKALPFIFIGSFFANYEGMVNQNAFSIVHGLVSAFADTSAPWIASALISRHVGEKSGIETLVPLTWYGAIIPTTISGIIISINLYVGAYIERGEMLSLLGILIFSDAMGFLLLYPLYQSYETLSRPTQQEWRFGTLYAVSASILVLLSFELHYFIFLLYPLLVVAAFKMRIHMVMSLLFSMIILIIVLCASKNYLFLAHDTMEASLMLMAYLISLVFVVLGVALHNMELLKQIDLTYTDHLTQIRNKKSYQEVVSKLLSLQKRYQTPFSMIMFDIDDFKMINDTYEHRTGDEVLVKMSQLIVRHIRHYDTLFRIGGEEFVILCLNTPLNDAKEVAEKIRHVVENHLDVISPKAITISLGVTESTTWDSEETLYYRVDQFMYQSKHNGKNQVTAH